MQVFTYSLLLQPKLNLSTDQILLIIMILYKVLQKNQPPPVSPQPLFKMQDESRNSKDVKNA